MQGLQKRNKRPGERGAEQNGEGVMGLAKNSHPLQEKAANERAETGTRREERGVLEALPEKLMTVDKRLVQRRRRGRPDVGQEPIRLGQMPFWKKWRGIFCARGKLKSLFSTKWNMLSQKEESRGGTKSFLQGKVSPFALITHAC